MFHGTFKQIQGIDNYEEQYTQTAIETSETAPYPGDLRAWGYILYDLCMVF